MFYAVAAESVLIVHLAFIVFVMLGGALAIRHRAWAAVHLPAAAWGAYVELSGRICPLTAWENALRVRAGQAGYRGSFIEHYLLAVIYPAGLTRAMQFGLAALVIAVNAAVYRRVLRRRRAR
jgi:hypothetical protein